MGNEEKALLLPQNSNNASFNAKNKTINNSNGEYILYTRRWYILLLFSCLSAQQSNLWITFGAVADTAKSYYKTTDANINLLATLGPVAYIPVATAISWAIGEYGLRKTSLGAIGLCTIAAVIRCFATSSTFWIVIVAQILNAAAGPIVMSAPPAVSAAWFGVNERTFATAVSSLANYLGSSLGFLFGLLVHNNRTFRILLYSEGIFTVLLFIGFVIYFPSAPPTPPSATASVKKPTQSFAKSWASLLKETWGVLKQKDGLLLVLAGGMTSGAYSGWAAMAVLILMPLGYSQSQAQWLGFVNTVVGIVGGLAAGWIHDRYRHFKLLLIVLFFASGAAFGVFTLAANQFWVFNFAEILAVSTCGGLLVNSLYPITFEAVVEVTFPIKEEVGASLLTLLNNIACLTFLIAGDYMKPGYMNWILSGTAIGAVFLTLLVKEEYKRTNIDLKV